MNFSQFFISRPIFAAVLSLLILIAGAISLFQLPISEYPSVVPPTVVVRANFPGANPKVIGETVAAPLEQAITEYLTEHNADPKPFAWVADADSILDRIKKVCKSTSDSGH